MSLRSLYYTLDTETKMSFWRNFHHWLHWKLSFWQLPVQPVMNISSKWRLFRFSGWEQKENFIEFEIWWKTVREMGPRCRFENWGILIDFSLNCIIFRSCNSVWPIRHPVITEINAELSLLYHEELILSKLLSTCKLIFQASPFSGRKKCRH